MGNFKDYDNKQLSSQFDSEKNALSQLNNTNTTEYITHDLQVHQLELEMQNRELRESQQLLEQSRDRYADLYDFAPVGYITFDHAGCIKEMNLTATSLLGSERSRLLGKPFSLWLEAESITQFFDHLKEALNSQVKVTQELKIKNNKNITDIRLESVSANLFNNDEKQELLCNSVIIDITAIKQNDSALKQERDFAEGLINTAQTIILLLDINGCIVRFNPYMETLSGYSLNEVRGKNWFDTFLVKTELATVRHIYNQAIMGNNTRGNIYSILTKNEQERIIEWYDTTLKDEQGDIEGLLAIGLDITDRVQTENQLAEYRQHLKKMVRERTADLNDTNNSLKKEICERKQIEAALRDSQQQFRNTFEQAAVGIVHVGLEGSFLKLNRKFCDILGYSREELLNLSFKDITSPEDLAMDKNYVQQVLSGDIDTYSIEKHFVCKNTSLVWVNLTVSLLKDSSGKPNYFIIVVEDISERKDAEKKLLTFKEYLEDAVVKRTAELKKSNELLEREIEERKFAESALRDRERQLTLITDALPVLISYIDKNERYQFVNKAYEKWFNKKQSEIEGKSVKDILGEAAYEKKAGSIALALSGTEVDYEQSLSYNHLGLRYVRAQYIPEKDEQGKIKGYFSLVTDNTERKRLEDEAQQQQKELARVARLNTLGEMASALAHELNQPLCAITNYAQASIRLLNSETSDIKDIIAAMQAASSESKRASDIIRSIRQFVKPDDKIKKLEDVNEIIRESVNLTTHESTQRGVKMVMQLDESLPLLKLDKTQIQQVVVNLLRNGMDAMVDDHHSRREFVVTTRVDNNVEVSIKDTGPGIDTSISERLFHPFITTKEEGMGLGLSISQKIIQTHGGKLWWESNIDHGVTFTFSLPTDSLPTDKNGVNQ